MPVEDGKTDARTDGQVASGPIRFCFGVHLHQPVGNFDSVFEEHLRDVYRPLLNRLAESGFLPVTLHLSGPLLDWLDAHEPAYLDQIGELARAGSLELLLSGYYEPVLASLPRPDRVEQIGWMREAIESRFGVTATGLWLTERVWEPELAADLADAGVRYCLVDDRHFLVTGFAAEQLHAPYRTESDGRGVALFPIDERLRYLIPFQPPEDTAAYLRSLRAAGHRLAVLADDGEKFGGWPGTREWVYERGWLDRFLATLRTLTDSGEVQLSTLSAALDAVPSAGLAYLPTASYREMEAWSLPPEPALRLARLETDAGPDRVQRDGALIRGSHWRNFLVKYPESNRMHKKMQLLSALARDRGDPPEARRAIGRAQCNDAYWHGVFGGLYLPHLRDAIWRNLAAAERELRRGEPLTWEVLDVDGDGHAEIRISSAEFSATVSPARGGAIEEFTHFASGTNLANTLTRRREAYHQEALEREAPARETAAGAKELSAPSIHDIEAASHLASLPPVDLDDRAIFVDRMLAAGTTRDDLVQGIAQPVWSGATARTADVRAEADGIVVRLSTGLAPHLEKELAFSPAGRVVAQYRWNPADFPADAVFAPELSLADNVEPLLDPAVEVWTFPITTVAKSERGFDETVQGRSVVPRWPASAGSARIELSPGRLAG